MSVRERFREILTAKLARELVDADWYGRSEIDGWELYGGVAEQLVAEAVAEERAAILDLGMRYGYDGCDDFKDAIKQRDQPRTQA